MYIRLVLFLAFIQLIPAIPSSAAIDQDTLRVETNLAIEVAERLQNEVDSLKVELSRVKTEKNELLDTLSKKELKIASVGAVLALIFCFMSLFLFMLLRLRRRIRIGKEEADNQK
jgi:hypothetical protein